MFANLKIMADDNDVTAEFKVEYSNMSVAADQHMASPPVRGSSTILKYVTSFPNIDFHERTMTCTAKAETDDVMSTFIHLNIQCALKNWSEYFRRKYYE